MGLYSRIEKISSSESSHKYAHENRRETVTGLHDAITNDNNLKSMPPRTTEMHGYEGDKNRVETNWEALAASSLTDMDVDDLDQALFLFALRKTQKTDIADIRDVWNRYALYWRRRLPAEAFRLVIGAYQERLGGAGETYEQAPYKL